jgi:hypothetical protein
MCIARIPIYGFDPLHIEDGTVHRNFHNIFHEVDVHSQADPRRRFGVGKLLHSLRRLKMYHSCTWLSIPAKCLIAACLWYPLSEGSRKSGQTEKEGTRRLSAVGPATRNPACGLNASIALTLQAFYLSNAL